jgi:hypothetical protein
VRATTLAWSKEKCLKIGISRLPHDAKYIGTFDADIHFRKPGWAAEAIHALQLYPGVQPWKTAYDLGPNYDYLHAHVSFASIFHAGKPITPKGDIRPRGLFDPRRDRRRVSRCRKTLGSSRACPCQSQTWVRARNDRASLARRQDTPCLFKPLGYVHQTSIQPTRRLEAQQLRRA